MISVETKVNKLQSYYVLILSYQRLSKNLEQSSVRSDVISGTVEI